MGKILVIKGADFSAVSVEKTNIIENITQWTTYTNFNLDGVGVVNSSRIVHSVGSYKSMTIPVIQGLHIKAKVSITENGYAISGMESATDEYVIASNCVIGDERSDEYTYIVPAGVNYVFISTRIESVEESYVIVGSN